MYIHMPRRCAPTTARICWGVGFIKCWRACHNVALEHTPCVYETDRRITAPKDDARYMTGAEAI